MIDKDEQFRKMLYETVSGQKASSDKQEFDAQCKEFSDLLGKLIKLEGDKNEIHSNI